MGFLNRYKLLAACLLLVCALFLAAQAEPAVTVAAEMGYEHTITYLSAMPLRVRLKNAGTDAELTVAVNLYRNRQEYDRYEYPVFLAGGAETALTLPVSITYKQPAYTVEVLADGQTVAQADVRPQKVMAPDTLLVGVLSDQPQALRTLNINETNDPMMRGETWQTLVLDAATFPDRYELLRAFRILAVDGFDIATLSENQHEALSRWLREGGIVLVGGGASASVSGRGFMAYTGVMMGMPAPVSQVEKALESALAEGSFALKSQPGRGGSVLVSSLSGSRNAVAMLGGKPLIDRCPVGQGVVYTAGFSLGDAALNAWSGMSGYWQRLLLTCDRTRYQGVITALQNYQDTYNSNGYVDTWLLRQMPMENPDSVWLIVGLTAAFLVLGGIGGYLLLRRFDKREWLWLAAPALCLLCAVLTLTLSRGMQLRKPAAAAYAVVAVGTDGQTKTNIMAGVASSERTPMRISGGAGETLSLGSLDYGYYEDDEEAEKAAPKLRYTYAYGEPMTITLPAAAAWEVHTLFAEPAQSVACPVSATIWWEQDGLHGEIVNGSDLTLDAGYVFTNQGFCPVPALQPGARHAFSILENPERTATGDSVTAYPGEIVPGGYAETYSIVSSALYPNGYDAAVSGEMAFKRNMIESCQGKWNQRAAFHYVAFSDQVPRPQLLINGENVGRMAYNAVIDTEIAYQAVGADGLVRLNRGMIPAYSAELNGQGKPASISQSLQDYTYFALRDEPALCFALGECAAIDLESLTIDQAQFTCESYGAKPRLYLYNAPAGSWLEIAYSALPAAIDGDTLRACLDEDGRLYLRLMPGTGGANSEIYNPALTLEGRML